MNLQQHIVQQVIRTDFFLSRETISYFCYSIILQNTVINFVQSLPFISWYTYWWDYFKPFLHDNNLSCLACLHLPIIFIYLLINLSLFSVDYIEQRHQPCKYQELVHFWYYGVSHATISFIYTHCSNVICREALVMFTVVIWCFQFTL